MKLRNLPMLSAFSPLDHHQNRYAALLDQLVSEGDSWLDVGAGTQLHDGWLGTPQGSVAARAKLLAGCDVHFSHLRSNPFLTVHVGASVYELPFADASYELVTTNMVLEHLEDPVRAFSEISRVLKPGGCFVFVTPNINNPIIRSAWLMLSPSARQRLAHLIEKREEEHIFPTFYRANSSKSVARFAEESGLRVERLETFFSDPFTNGIPVLRAVERAYIAGVRLFTGNALGTNLIGVLRRP
jgi:SAM-dependent methyltransferase